LQYRLSATVKVTLSDRKTKLIGSFDYVVLQKLPNYFNMQAHKKVVRLQTHIKLYLELKVNVSNMEIIFVKLHV